MCRTSRIDNIYLEGTLERDDGEVFGIVCFEIPTNHLDTRRKSGTFFVRIVIDGVVPVFGEVVERVFEGGREE